MCAYCTMAEVEASAVRFTIDHYEPTSARPDLENEYSNLMYACDPCNMRKGDRYPPSTARAEGIRFFRPDEDIHAEHFKISGIRLEADSKTGVYTIDALDLNRHMLRKLREIRMRTVAADEYVARGIAALRHIHLDQIPAHLKGKVHSARQSIIQDAEIVRQEVDDLLRDEARSELIDNDSDATSNTAQDRLSCLKALEAVFLGNWRGRNEIPKA